MTIAEKGIFGKITELARQIGKPLRIGQETSIEKAQRISSGIISDQDIVKLKKSFINKQEIIYLSELTLRGPGDEVRVFNEANDTTARYLASIKLFEAVIPDSTWEEELMRISKQEVQSST